MNARKMAQPRIGTMSTSGVRSVKYEDADKVLKRSECESHS